MEVNKMVNLQDYHATKDELYRTRTDYFEVNYKNTVELFIKKNDGGYLLVCYDKVGDIYYKIILHSIEHVLDTEYNYDDMLNELLNRMFEADFNNRSIVSMRIAAFSARDAKITEEEIKDD
jgi:hypothetical protein